MKSLTVRFAVLALALAGCSGQGDHSAPQSSRSIGMSGGSVSLASNAAAAGATAFVPAGALVQATVIAINDAAAPSIGGFTAVGPAFTVSPDGIALLNSQTVTITAPAAPPSTVPMGTVQVLLVKANGDVVVLSQASATGTAVSVSTDSFGTFEAVVLAPIDPAGSTVTPSSTDVTADGTSTATITVVVLDANGVGVPNATVTLAATGSNNTLGTPGPTDAKGSTQATISSTTAETKTISVTVTPSTGGAPVAIQAQPTITFN